MAFFAAFSILLFLLVIIYLIKTHLAKISFSDNSTLNVILALEVAAVSAIIGAFVFKEVLAAFELLQRIIAFFKWDKRSDDHGKNHDIKEFVIGAAVLVITCIASILVILHAQTRAAASDIKAIPSPSVNTYAIYSWQDIRSGKLHYVLLSVDRLNDTFEEISAEQSVVDSVEQLMGQLAQLKPGTFVIWKRELKNHVFLLPPQKTRNTISTFTSKRQLHLSFEHGEK